MGFHVSSNQTSWERASDCGFPQHGYDGRMAKLSMMSLLFLIVLFGQTAAPPAVEVASIKEALPLSIENVQAGQFHVGMNINGSRADYGFMSLADLIPYAYRVKRYQLSGPGWMNETRWDILAKIPAGQRADRAPEMMQNLLAERFKLAIHRENREQSVYALVVGKGALKIKQAAGEEEVAGVGDSLSTVRINNDGRSGVISGGATGTVHVSAGSNGMQMQMARITMATLADVRMQFTDRPVVDATELKGNYQVTLELPADLMNGMPAAQKLTAILGLGSFGMVPDTWDAAMLQAVKGLGLELKSRKAPVETIIVDHVEKISTAN
jgi:uncharacterized protein (TIGR03435 family)